jgi:hypothetical protein
MLQMPWRLIVPLESIEMFERMHTACVRSPRFARCVQSSP